MPRDKKLNATAPCKFWLRFVWCLTTLSSLTMISPAAIAADLQPVPESSPPPAELASGWTFRVIPYAWLAGLYGSATVKGRTVGVNLPFDKILELTVGKGNLPVALMGDFEARYGPFSVYSDLVWMKVDGSGSRVHTHSFAPQITGAIGTAHDVTIRMGIAEAAGMYEITCFINAPRRQSRYSGRDRFDCGCSLLVPEGRCVLQPDSWSQHCRPGHRLARFGCCQVGYS